jgi:geranylgeranyl diphosphate synthase type I
MQIPYVLNKYRSAIDSELRSLFASYRLPIYDMMRYHLGWIDELGNESVHASGKALRPTLCLMSAEAVGRDCRAALPVAAAVELIHNFSLIHDDIQDDDEERRHRRTVWKIWGKPQAINAGSAMRVLANLALDRVKNNGLTPEKHGSLQAVLDESTLKLIEGQYLDISYERRFDVTVDDYMAMIRGKTAALVSCSMQAGAMTGTDDPVTIKRFCELGEHLGIAFQIRDDILGIWGDPKETGKPKGSDIRRKKKTLPVVLALEEGTGKVKEAVMKIFQKDEIGDGDVEIICDVLNEAGAYARVQEIVRGYSEKSDRLLRSINMDQREKNDFGQLVRFLTDRKY